MPVFALNDLLAWGVLRELRERGVAVPDDVRVIGFDDVEESAYMVPSLSTVNPGREAHRPTGRRIHHPTGRIRSALLPNHRSPS